MCIWRGKIDLISQFPRKNWAIIFALLVVNNTAFSVMGPSMYQFITNSREPPEESENEEDTGRFWPGLGGTETLYAWAVLAFGIGEAAISPVAGLTTERYSYVFSLFAALILFISGGLFYARATEVWMVIVARLVLGLGSGYGAVVVHSYLGEMSSKLDKIRAKQSKKSIKHIFYIIFVFVINGSFVFSFGATSVVSLFDVNPYHWPGYFISALAILYGCIVLLFFRDNRSPPKLKQLVQKWHCLSGLRLMTQLKTKWKMEFIIYGYLTICGLAGGHLYSIQSTLITPVLSDHFGFSVKYMSYYLIALAVVLFVSSFILTAVKVFNIDNRKVLGAAFVLAFVGAGLIGNWQAIRHENPCSNWNVSVTLSSNTSLHQEWCETLRNSSHQCFWNQQSPITGEFCNTCRGDCLSKQTINFYQFSVGILLIASVSRLVFVLVSAIASDIAPVTSQGRAMSIVIAAPSVARIVSPLWLVESYRLTDEHTYISATVTALLFLSVLLGLVVLYNKLAPKRIVSKSPKHEATNHSNDLEESKVPATINMDLE